MPTNYVVPTSTGFRLAGLNPATKPADLGLEFLGETAHLAFKAAAIQPYKRTRSYKNFSSNFGVSVSYVGGQSLTNGVLAPMLSLLQFDPNIFLRALASLFVPNWKRSAQWLGEKVLALQATAGGSVNTIKAAILKQFL